MASILCNKVRLSCHRSWFADVSILRAYISLTAILNAIMLIYSLKTEDRIFMPGTAPNFPENAPNSSMDPSTSKTMMPTFFSR